VNYPVSIEEKLGFDKIRELLKKETSTDIGKEAIDKITFSNQYNKIQESLQLISELELLSQTGQFSHTFFEFLEDVLSFLNPIEKEGAIIYEEEWQVISSALSCFNQMYLEVNKQQHLLPLMTQKQSRLVDLTPCLRLINEVIDVAGKMKPDASPALKTISNSINEKEREIRKILLSKFELAKKNDWAGDTEITIRNERLVIPIIAEHKRKINGFVHDDSQSGKFLYIEPIECFEGNNQLKELVLERKKEVERILKQLTKDVSVYKQAILHHVQWHAFMDVVVAKQRLSSKLKAIAPDIVKEQSQVHLINAKHPLLFLQFDKDNKKIEPLNFQTNKNIHLILISGPNAGGKSIALKTIGLLQYMLQCGLKVPVSVGSSMKIYDGIFIDIGDNQSIENNLSSYSSHLWSMKTFMSEISSKSLYLIDEIGNGTDPSIGSSIAQAILEQFLKAEAFGVVTTHFGELKAWASETKGVINARMLYDLQHLEPLFKLELGKPGSSFALEVASKVGLKSQVIERVREVNKWKNQIDLDELIAENEKNKQELVENNKRIQEKEKVLDRLLNDYQQLKEELMSSKQAILKTAKQKAEEIIDESNKKVEQTIKEIKVANAEKEKTKKIRADLEKHKKQIEPKLDEEIKQVQKTKPVEVLKLKVGDWVVRNGQTTSGEVLTLKSTKAEVLFGQIKMWLNLSDLSRSQAMSKKSMKNQQVNIHLFEKQSQFYPNIDVRGVRGEEAVQKISSFLEDAHLIGAKDLKVIHGRGHGILRTLIKEHLKQNKWVKKFEFETEQLGGDGVTLITLK
jgi:DNA mismatch repair protein MutS2